MTEETLQEREARLIKEIEAMQERADKIHGEAEAVEEKIKQTQDIVLKEHYHNCKIDLNERYGNNKYEMQDRARALSLVQRGLKKS